MQANERIGVQPMTSRHRLAVDNGHLDVRLGHQRVDERKPGRPRPHNQIIRIDTHCLLPVSWLARKSHASP